MSDKPVVAEYMVTFGDDGPAPHIALLRMSPLAFAWRRFIFRLDPCVRRPWRLWYWTGLCHLWEREACRMEFALVPVPMEWADEHFDWEWRKTNVDGTWTGGHQDDVVDADLGDGDSDHGGGSR